MNAERRGKFKVSAQSSQRWVISYADFLTLLFAFFAFLFSVSTLEQEKFQQVSQTLIQLFDVAPTSVDPIELQATPKGPDFFNPLYLPEPIPGTQIDQSAAQKHVSQASLISLQSQIGKEFQQLIENQLFSVSGNESWVEIQLADSITFLPNSADITDQAEAILYEVGKLIAQLPYPVSVEGYSIQAESDSVEFSWQLSSMRAATVSHYLNQAGVAGERLSAIGFAHFQNNLRPISSVQLGSISISIAGFDESVRRP